MSPRTMASITVRILAAVLRLPLRLHVPAPLVEKHMDSAAQPASFYPDPAESVKHSPSYPTDSGLEVIRRNRSVVAFQPEKIAIAITKAFLAVEGQYSVNSARIREQVAQLTASVIDALTRRLPGGGTVYIEDIQDQVELALMRSGAHDVARAYVLYREKHAAQRAAQQLGGISLYLDDIAKIGNVVKGAVLFFSAVAKPASVLAADVGISAVACPEPVVGALALVQNGLGRKSNEFGSSTHRFVALAALE